MREVTVELDAADVEWLAGHMTTDEASQDQGLVGMWRILAAVRLAVEPATDVVLGARCPGPTNPAPRPQLFDQDRPSISVLMKRARIDDDPIMADTLADLAEDFTPIRWNEPAEWAPPTPPPHGWWQRLRGWLR